MLKKFSTSLFLMLLIFSFSLTIARDKGPVKTTALDGSEVGVVNENFTPATNTDHFGPVTTSAYPVTITSLGFASFYDLQSNGSTNEIWQNPLAPDNVHIAVMSQPIFGSTRFCSYVLSTDRGATWSTLGNVAESQSGFPSISGFNDNGVAVISMHTTAGGVAAARTQFFVDQGAGFGVFDRLDPGLNGTVSMIWGRLVTTGLSTNPVKFVNGSSENAGTELAGTVNATSITPPGTISAWQNYPSETAEQYSFAVGQDGRIGNAFISITDQGSVMFRESTDGGLTWGTMQTVFDANIAADSVGAFRGISMVYLQNTPCVTFELDLITETGLFPTLPSRIAFWSPAVNGGTLKILADENNVPFFPNIGPSGSYGVYTPLCRPVIGKTNDAASPVLFLAFNGTTNQTAADSNVYYATFFLASYNGGNSWTNSTNGTAPERITPATPLKDYRYVSLSQTNSLKSSNPGAPWLVQMAVEVKDYAGAFAPNMPPSTTDYASMRVEVPFTSVNNISNEVPAAYSLKQNFPNPFNPTTSIRFDMRKASNVTLKVYNSNGQEVATLINNEYISTGTKEVTFTGSEFSSGIYFYTLTAGDFKETKKMMLIK